MYGARSKPYYWCEQKRKGKIEKEERKDKRNLSQVVPAEETHPQGSPGPESGAGSRRCGSRTCAQGSRTRCAGGWDWSWCCCPPASDRHQTPNSGCCSRLEVETRVPAEGAGSWADSRTTSRHQHHCSVPLNATG